ncbi:MAG: hypothetical protein RIT27_1724 [Pseudomonadota bacterium]|jgi:competence ComEA-like helix-hairpin-helix protein
MKLLKSLIYSLFFVSFVNAAEPTATTLIDLNTADEAALETLSGIGAKKAKDIIEYRRSHGGFKSVEEFGKIPGIGPKTFEANRARLTVGNVSAQPKALEKPAATDHKPIDNKPTISSPSAPTTGMSGMSQPPKM